MLSSSSREDSAHQNQNPEKMKNQEEEEDGPVDEKDSVEEDESGSEWYGEEGEENDLEEQDDSEEQDDLEDSDGEEDSDGSYDQVDYGSYSEEDDSDEEQLYVHREKKKSALLKGIKETDDLPELTGTFSRIPRDVFMKILSWLPLRSLCRARLVSKGWFFMIRHPRFAKLHLTKSVNNPKANQSVIFLDDDGKSFLIDHQRFDKLKSAARLCNLRLPDGVTFGDSDSFEAHSCNGLLFSQKPFYISNPITGDAMELPPPNYKKLAIVSGFGFDPVSEEYKVIRVLGREYGSYPSKVEIITLGSDSWRLLSKVPYSFRQSPGVFFKGAFHWLAFENGKSRRSGGVIVTFKIDTEEFDKINLPRVSSTTETVMYLVVLGECLCLVEKVKKECTETWVLEKYGVPTSWRNKYCFYKVAGYVKVFSQYIGWNYDPIQMLKTGEILLLYNQKHLGFYEPKTDTVRPIEFYGDVHAKALLYPLVHMGSLISPKSIRRTTESDDEDEDKFNSDSD